MRRSNAYQLAVQIISGLFVFAFCSPAWGSDKPASSKSIALPADNPAGELKPGPGVEVVRANCAICHSTDYIVRQPGAEAQRWEGEVRKMITVFGAPIDEAAVKVIVRYLASAYGPAPEATLPPRKPRNTTLRLRPPHTAAERRLKP